jgi:hypothetical protein
MPDRGPPALSLPHLLRSRPRAEAHRNSSGGDPVVVLEVTAGNDSSFKREYVVLRLAVHGVPRVHFSLREQAWGRP